MLLRRQMIAASSADSLVPSGMMSPLQSAAPATAWPLCWRGTWFEPAAISAALSAACELYEFARSAGPTRPFVPDAVTTPPLPAAPPAAGGGTALLLLEPPPPQPARATRPARKAPATNVRVVRMSRFEEPSMPVLLSVTQVSLLRISR